MQPTGKKSKNYGGGQSDEPLEKTLLLHGFASWAEAAEQLCKKITNVQLKIAPPTHPDPVCYLTAVYDTTEYYFRLTKGFDGGALANMQNDKDFSHLE